MLLEELVLHNFGIYRGRHTINLLPESADKPIVLFGALNGGGKTTLLDGLKLALYGKFADCSNRGSHSYPGFLQRSINHHVDPNHGAGVELQFKHRRDGKEETIRIIRTWRSVGKTLKESVDVLRDGRSDEVIAERWYEYIDEFMPAQIASLFFFDGEKIESLASEEQSSELIRTGLHALLGLDLVDRLSKDLLTVANKRRTALASGKEQKQLEESRQHIQALHERSNTLKREKAKQLTGLDKINNTINEYRADYMREGGDLLEQRDVITAEKNATELRLADAETNLRETAAGQAPLLLVRNLINSAREQVEREEATIRHQSIRKTLVERDEKLISSLNEQDIDESTINTAQKFLSHDLKKRDQENSVETYLNVGPEVFHGLDDESLDSLQQTITEQRALAEKIREKLSDLERKIGAIPNPEAIEGISKKLQDSESERKKIEITIAVLENDLEKIDRELESQENTYKRRLESAAADNYADENSQRVLEQSEGFRKSLATFRERVAAKHILQLEKLILDSFHQLIRKADLVHKITITPGSYELKLYDASNNHIPTERLSAGERQLLAISILWGLAKASDRPLPAVIDTPLGRLDSNHRNFLVENYFPCASHQVLLLSTDEEIDEKYHKDLKPYTTHEYEIGYSKEHTTSKVEPGYFWPGEQYDN